MSGVSATSGLRSTIGNSIGRRWNSNGKPEFDILQLVTQAANQKATKLNNSYLDYPAPSKSRFNNIISNVSFDEDPKLVLRLLPRTGPGMGTTIEVRDGNVKSAMNQLSRLLRNEKVRETAAKQRFHMKPSKLKGQEKTRKRKEWFHAGLTQLFNSVKAAKRRGY